MLKLTDITKQYDAPGERLTILNGITLALEPSESAAIMGPSGCGKSTLLNIAGALEAPTSGRVTLGGVDPYQLPEQELARYRNTNVGFVFQDHCLLPQLNVLENVLIPLMVGPADGAAPERATRLLGQVGLSARLRHRPAELSGGEKQRVAIARALIRNPPLLLCDEPTGNLDQHTAEQIADLLKELQAVNRTILLVVTHSQEIAAHFGRQYRLESGQLCTYSA